MRHTLAVSLLVTAALSLAAGPCTAEAKVKAPKPFKARQAVSLDTVRVAAAPCNIGEPAVSCRVLTTGTAGAQTLVFGPAVTLAPGGQLAALATFTCTPAAVILIAVSVSSVAVNRSGTQSAPTTSGATSSYTCADGPPGPPAPFTVTITVGP